MHKHTLTQKGLALLAKQQANQAEPNVTRVVAGPGHVNPEELELLTEIVDPIAQMEVGEKMLLDGKIVRLPLQLVNTKLSETALVSQIGVYSMDPDEGEILYQVAQYELPVPIPAYAYNNYGMILFEPELDIIFSNSELALAPSTPGFLLTLEKFLKTQPIVEIATVQHNLGILPVVALYPTQFAYGVGGYGEGPYGGILEANIPVKAEPIDWNTIKVFTIPQYAGDYAVSGITDHVFGLSVTDQITTLTLVLR